MRYRNYSLHAGSHTPPVPSRLPVCRTCASLLHAAHTLPDVTFVCVFPQRAKSLLRAASPCVYFFLVSYVPTRIESHVILADPRRLDMHATQKQQILPNESPELTTPSSEHSRDGKAVDHRGGSAPESQASQSLPGPTPNDGLYGEVHSNVSDALPDAKNCLLNVSIVDVPGISARRRSTCRQCLATRYP